MSPVKGQGRGARESQPGIQPKSGNLMQEANTYLESTKVYICTLEFYPFTIGSNVAEDAVELNCCLDAQQTLCVCGARKEQAGVSKGLCTGIVLMQGFDDLHDRLLC